MNLDLQDQTAVVIGAGRGIGLAIATAFAEEGCRVGLVDRDPAIQKLAASLGAECRGEIADATSFDDGWSSKRESVPSALMRARSTLARRSLPSYPPMT